MCGADVAESADAVVLAAGATKPRDLAIEGRCVPSHACTQQHESCKHRTCMQAPHGVLIWLHNIKDAVCRVGLHNLQSSV